jgi:hypothetical protein
VVGVCVCEREGGGYWPVVPQVEAVRHQWFGWVGWYRMQSCKLLRDSTGNCTTCQCCCLCWWCWRCCGWYCWCLTPLSFQLRGGTTIGRTAAATIGRTAATTIGLTAATTVQEGRVAWKHATAGDALLHNGRLVRAVHQRSDASSSSSDGVTD